MLGEFKNELNKDVEDVDQSLLKNYSNTTEFTNMTYEILLGQNYFESESLYSQPNVEKFGTNRDFYFNLI
ncbi:MAG TPA: hypothetical protein PLC61_04705 [Chitinophagales bacterium]|nr:hypothetical protein [Chitinophagales bacterium]